MRIIFLFCLFNVLVHISSLMLVSPCMKINTVNYGTTYASMYNTYYCLLKCHNNVHTFLCMHLQ